MVGQTVLVIGAGSIGRRHAANLDRLGEKFELIPWRDHDRAIIDGRRDVGAVVIATATPIRLDLLAMCAENGWPFYCEKPLAWRVSDVDQLYRVAAPVADRSMLGFMMRYHPAIRALFEIDLTTAYRFHFNIGHDVRQWRANWRFSQSYAAAAEGGGVLLDLCHETDIANALFPGLGVSGANSIGHVDFPGVDFATSVSLVSGSGVQGTVAMDYLSPVSQRRMAVDGLARVVNLDLVDPVLLTISDAGNSATQGFEFDRNDMYLDAMRDFLALVSGKTGSANPLMPRFDRMRSTADLIARAWKARRFTGSLDMAMD